MSTSPATATTPATAQRAAAPGLGNPLGKALVWVIPGSLVGGWVSGHPALRGQPSGSLRTPQGDPRCPPRPHPSRPQADQPADYERPKTSVRRTFTESKAGVKTTEFYVMVIFVAGVLLSTYADQDTLARRDGWFFAALAVGAYILTAASPSSVAVSPTPRTRATAEPSARPWTDAPDPCGSGASCVPRSLHRRRHPFTDQRRPSSRRRRRRGHRDRTDVGPGRRATTPPRPHRSGRVRSPTARGRRQLADAGIDLHLFEPDAATLQVLGITRSTGHERPRRPPHVPRHGSSDRSLTGGVAAGRR